MTVKQNLVMSSDTFSKILQIIELVDCDNGCVGINVGIDGSATFHSVQDVCGVFVRIPNVNGDWSYAKTLTKYTSTRAVSDILKIFEEMNQPMTLDHGERIRLLCGGLSVETPNTRAGINSKYIDAMFTLDRDSKGQRCCNYTPEWKTIANMVSNREVWGHGQKIVFESDNHAEPKLIVYSAYSKGLGCNTEDVNNRGFFTLDTNINVWEGLKCSFDPEILSCILESVMLAKSLFDDLCIQFCIQTDKPMVISAKNSAFEFVWAVGPLVKVK